MHKLHYQNHYSYETRPTPPNLLNPLSGAVGAFVLVWEAAWALVSGDIDNLSSRFKISLFPFRRELCSTKTVQAGICLENRYLKNSCSEIWRHPSVVLFSSVLNDIAMADAVVVADERMVSLFNA